MTIIFLFDNINSCNKYIVTWSGLESSSHINLCLCALFLWVIFMNFDEKLFELLLNNSKKAFRKGEIPVSAIIFDKNGNIISTSYNNRQKKYNVLGHAEINCIIKAEKKIKDWRLNGYSMIVSLEPCEMCSMVIKESRLDNIFYFLPKKTDNLESDVVVNKFIIDNYPEYTEKFKQLLTSFFDNKR